MSIAIRSKKDIDSLIIANRLVAETLEYLKNTIVAGLNLKEVDLIAESYIKSIGARPSFKGLYGFPSSVCASLNKVVIHGVPFDYVPKDGDILGIDIGIEKSGWYGDGALTFEIGVATFENKMLIECAKNTLYYAISIIEEGMRFKELSFRLESFIKESGYQPLRGYCGHGIGKRPHEEPEIPNYVDTPNLNQGPKIKNGMVFCIEPMICQKTGESEVLSDKWSVVSKDGLNTSHYEHTVAIIGKKAVILSTME